MDDDDAGEVDWHEATTLWIVRPVGVEARLPPRVGLREGDVAIGNGRGSS